MSLEEKLKLLKHLREKCISNKGNRAFAYEGRKFCPYNDFNFSCPYENTKDVVMGYGGLYWGCNYDEKTKTS